MSAGGRLSRFSRPWVGVVAAAATACTVVFGLFIVPPDRLQGDVQRIMYIHVPSAWLGYLGFFITFAASAAFLWRRDPRYDRVAVAGAELGLLFTGLTIVTGALWGKAPWGVWWDWDPRLTTTAILFVIYAGYVLLRGSIVDRWRRARLAAVLGIIGFADVPIVHFSVLWWRGLHQAPTVIQPGDPTISHLLLAALLLNLASFTLLFAWLLVRRVELEADRDQVLAVIGESEPAA